MFSMPKAKKKIRVWAYLEKLREMSKVAFLFMNKEFNDILIFIQMSSIDKKGKNILR